jgi:cystathionine gamma-lyase
LASGFSTKAIHAGSEPDSKFGGVNPSIDLSTTFVQSQPGKPVCFDYARCGNPTRLAFERNMAAMENAKYAFAMSSGVSCTLTIMNLLTVGDHVLCIDDVYGGTQRYLRRILGERQGVEVSFVDFVKEGEVEAAIRPNTKYIWAETPTNPTLKIFDIKAVAKIAKAHNILFVVDNTFFTPYLQVSI